MRTLVAPRNYVLLSNMLLILVTMATVGCSDGRPKRVPVSGQVLIDGEPVKGGSIQFVPVGARPSSSDLDEEGRFSLQCFEKGDGAVTGTHKVIVAARAMEGTKLKWYAPQEYADADTSGLTQEITEATDSLVIELTWKGKKKPRR